MVEVSKKFEVKKIKIRKTILFFPIYYCHIEGGTIEIS